MSLPADASGAIDWAAAGAQQLRQDQGEQIRQSVGQALPVNPDKEAELRRYAAAAQVPIDTARNQPEQVKVQGQMATFDHQQLQRQFPSLAQWLTVPQNAMLAHDDIPATGAVETAVGALRAPSAPMGPPEPTILDRAKTGDFWAHIAKYFFSANDGSDNLVSDVGAGARAVGNKIGATAALALGGAATVIGAEPGQELAFGLAKRFDDAAAADKAATGFHNKLMQSMASLAATFPAMLATGGGAAAPEAAAAVRTLGQFVGDALVHGAKSMAIPAIADAVETMHKVYAATGDLGKAALAAQAQYVLSTGAGVVPLSMPGRLATRLAGGAVVGATQGEVTREAMNQVLPPSMQRPFDPEETAISAASGSLMAGVMGPRIDPARARAAAVQAFNDAFNAAKGESDAQRLVDLSKFAQASKLRERDPLAFKAFVKDTADASGDLQGIYIEGRQLAAVLEQHGITGDELAQTMPAVAEQMPAALGENAPANALVRIPIEDFATHIAGSPIEEGLMQHVRLDPEGGTVAESKAYAEGQKADLMDRAERLTAANTSDAAYQESLTKVGTDLQQRLEAIGMRPEQAAANLAPLLAFHQVHADQLGILPHEFAERYPLRFATNAMEGLNQEVWFHGTSSDVRKFARIDGGNMWGPGHYFTDDPETASGYATGAAGNRIAPKGDAGPNVMPVHVADGEMFDMNAEATSSTRKRVEKALGESLKGLTWRGMKNVDLRQVLFEQFTDQAGANEVLKKAGFSGIIEDSPTAGPGRTLMVFDPKSVTSAIDGATLGQESRGTFSPSTKTISVLKGADLSTFQHELGHFFLDTMAHLAAQPDAPPAVQRDMQTLLKWFEVPGIDEWHRMSLDEQRASHEKFATGWETYLMKGSAPSLELRTVFQRFRSWIVSVYRGLKGAPGEFTPEVAGVFDRMIASEDAIRQAELARKYMPLFDSPEKAGMTPEEWTAYQATGKDATEQAIEALTGKSMKDMAWLDRLRTASLKAVQKDAAEKRRALAREVRAEVMAQPVYRAWAFLTGRGETDQMAAETPRQRAARALDPARDSLLVAIAKLGGIDRESAHRDAGVSSDDFKAESGVFGKPVFRKEGGMSADRMAEALAELHYLPLDEHGKHSLRDLEEAIADELGGTPRYSYSHDWGGEQPPQAQDTSHVTWGRLRTSDLREMFGLDEGGWKRLQDLRMTSDKRGIDPGIVADMFGFPDAHALVKALVAADRPRAVVDGLTDQHMLERHGELVDEASVKATADALVQNEVRARFVATELRALKQATGKPKDMVDAAKEVAENTIGTKRVRDIDPHVFDVAETRSATQAARLVAKGDTAGAAAAKRDQLLNMELGRAARDAKDYVAKALAYLAKFSRDSVREGIDLEYRDQIDALLDRADLRKGVSGAALDKREALLAFVERMAAQGYKPQIPESLLNEAQRWHYKDMPFIAFQGLVDSVKSIEHLGKLKNELRDVQETRRINDLADEVKASAAKLPQRAAESNRGLTRMESAWLNVKAAGRSAQAALLKMEQMFDWVDARDPNGALNRVVFRRLAEAGVTENNLLARVKADIDALTEKHLADITRDRKVYVADGLIDKATNLPQRFTTKEMLMLAGNMGNESNAAKMAKGEGWDQDQVWAFLHKNMTKAHWDFVAGMGRVLESLWPEKLAMDRRLGNTSPEKIQPRAFSTPHGDYDGWYWPLMYDPARSQDVAERGARAGDAMFENIYSRASTDTGRMNTRSEGYARPLLLDLDALPRMIKDEVHDIAFREAVIDADRFLSHPVVRKAIVDALSQQHYDQIRPWLQSIANDGKGAEMSRGMEFFNAVAHGARTRATIVGLGFRISTMLVHGMSAGAESISELGPRWMLSGLKDFANPGNWSAQKDFIFERSGEMRNRMNEVDRDVREHLREIDTRLMDPASGAVARGADLMKAHAYQGIAMLDMASALPTWMGAYKKALSPVADGGLGMGEGDAVYFADKTVRNAHGGTGIKDMARVQRGNEFQKLFTMFYTFWNHNINRIVDTAKLVASPEHRQAMRDVNHWTDGQIAATVIMRTLVYTIGVQVLHSLVHPPAKDADSESWLKWAAKELLASAFAGVPIARDLSAHWLGGRDYKVTPAASMVDAVGKTGVDSAHALLGKEVSDKWLKHTITTTGYVFGLPTGQLGGTAQFLWDVEQGNAHPESAKDWWNGVLHGDMHTP